MILISSYLGLTTLSLFLGFVTLGCQLILMGQPTTSQQIQDWESRAPDTRNWILHINSLLLDSSFWWVLSSARQWCKEPAEERVRPTKDVIPKVRIKKNPESSNTFLFLHLLRLVPTATD